MTALDIGKSVFSKTDQITIDSPSLDSSWREHVVTRISSLSKVAAVAVGLTFSAAPCLSQTSTPDPQLLASQSQLEWARDFRRQIEEKERRQESIIELYFNKLKDGKFVSSWESERTDLKIFNRFSGHDFSQRSTLAEHAGMSKEDFSSKSTSVLITGLDKEINAVSKSEEAPAVTINLPSALFRPTSHPQGSVCMVSANVHIVETHKEMQRLTGWSDDVMADFVIRHEMTHCIEQNDRYSRIAKELISKDITFGDLASSRTAADLKRSVETHKNAVITSVDHPDDKKRMKLFNAMQSSFSHAAAVNGEEISDALSILSLIKEGRLGASSIDNLCDARLKSRFRGEKHNTTKFLYSIKDDLEKNPEIINSWRENYSSEIADGKGLKIDDLMIWVAPKWLSYVNKKDETSRNIEELSQRAKNKKVNGIHKHSESVNSVLDMLNEKRKDTARPTPKIHP